MGFGRSYIRKKALPCRWLFKTKNEIKGCTQKEGIDYKETFSLVIIRFTSIRYLLALTVEYDLDIDQLGAVSASLQKDLNEDTYMAKLKGFNGSNKVCIRELKQSIWT